MEIPTNFCKWSLLYTTFCTCLCIIHDFISSSSVHKTSLANFMWFSKFITGTYWVFANLNRRYFISISTLQIFWHFNFTEHRGTFRVTVWQTMVTVEWLTISWRAKQDVITSICLYTFRGTTENADIFDLLFLLSTHILEGYGHIKCSFVK